MRCLILLILLFPFFLAQSQERIINGVVLDGTSHEKLIFATVYNPDSKVIYYTDLDGKFTVKVKEPEKSFLYVKYVGYPPKLQEVNPDCSFVTIHLEEGMVDDPMKIVKYKVSKEESSFPVDTLTGIFSRYNFEIDSIQNTHKALRE